MDRGKLPVKRGPKIKALPLPVDFIALGSKSARTPSTPESISEPKLGSSQLKGSHSLQIPGPSSERKRDAGGVTALNPPLNKKSKLSTNQPVNVISRTPGIKKEKDLKKEQWDSIAVDIDTEEFVSQVQEAEENGDAEQIERLLCGSVKYLRANRAKPEPALYLGLLYLVKTDPSLFRSDVVVEAFSTLLKRDVSLNFKSKGNALVSVLAANILMVAYQEEKNWPDIMITVYLDDALGERIWVDHDDCKGFVDNIQTAFNTKIPPKSMLQPEFGFKPDICPSPPPLLDDEETVESATNTDSKDAQDIAVLPRFSHIQEHVEHYVLEIIREQVARRQPMDNISRNVLRLLTCTCGLSEVRLLVSQRLEIWLQNPKLMRPAQELLLSVCLNCNQRSQQDMEVISHLTKIRLKTKPLINHYLICIRELLNQNEENLGILLKHTIYNELSNSRNPNNMALLGVMFQYSSDQTAKTLAEVFQDLLMNRDDYLRALRALFREIVRSLRYDMNFSAFCLGLIQERKDAQFRDLDPAIKERMFLSVADLITLSIFTGITQAVREAASANARGDKKDMSVLRQYQQLVANIQRDAVWWLQTIAPRMYKPSRQDFIHCIRKILFMEQAEQYHKPDNWPPENDRQLMLRLASEIPVLENTLLRVLLIGLSKEHPLNPPDAHELAEQLVKRAAAIYTEDFQVIQVDSIDLIDVLFNICTYHYPENITLPAGYNPPNLAISNLYWKAWIMLLIITAHNPSTFGYAAWENFPTLKSFIEMSITNHFIFPPPTMAIGDKADEIKSRELQITLLEKQEILEFENHLASASTKVTITEGNSLLLPQLTTMDPSGIARKPPPNILEQLKIWNHNLKLGHLLCRSRNPDFLLDIIQRQGTSQSMPWLADLVESNEGSFSALPVQCLCEFLLNESPESLRVYAESEKEDKEESKSEKAEKAKKKEKIRKQQQLLQHLHNLLHENNDDSRSTAEVLDYFLRRLSSQQSHARNQAMKGLRMIISPPLKSQDDEEEEEDMSNGKGEENSEFNWLLKYLPNLTHFEALRADISLSLRQACLVETNPWVVSAYIQFLSTYAPDEQLQEMADLGLNMAQLIVERTTIVNFILPCEGGPVSEQKMLTLQSLMVIFLKYLRKAREPSKEAYSWSESQDQIIVQWPSGEVATMHVLVVHAMVILLTYGPPEDTLLFTELLDIWFPKNCELPQAFLVDTSEEALLLPDWLKLRMIRSSVDLLVDAALRDLDPSQLVLFIQSFGIPITSVSKLLHALDIAVEFDGYAVESAVIDKGYMSQLVEVQQQRGAIGGHKFAELLDEGIEPEFFETESTIPNKEDTKPLVMHMPVASIHPDSVKNKLVCLFNLDNSLSRNLQQQDIFRSLQKSLTLEIQSEEKPVTVKVIICLSQLVNSPDGMKVVNALHQFSSFSCPLFRMLQMSQFKSKTYIYEMNILKNLQETIFQMPSAIRSPLNTILKQSLKEAKPKIIKDVKVSSKSSTIPFELTVENVIETIEETAKTDLVHLEQVVDRIAMHSLQAKNSFPFITALLQLLLRKSQTQSSSLFVDWLELMEPEIVSSSPGLEQLLLFSHRGETEDKKSFDRPVNSLRPCLLTKLIHQASWPIIHQCLAEILQAVHLNNFDSSAVLDFISACIFIPKIWQGRDKHIPKHYVEENLLGFSINQMLCIIDYVLTESSSLTKTDESNIKTEDLSDEIVEKQTRTEGKLKTDTSFSGHEVLMTLEIRLPLILHCCNDHEELMPAVVNHLLSIIEQKTTHSLTASYLLQQLYLKVPQLINWFDKTRGYIQDCGKLLSSSSKLDAISQTLLTALASTDVGKQWNDKIQDIDLASRKMASCHPNLLLRQLSMLASLLRGRNQLEFSVFKARNHLHFFTCVLGLLELLQPHLFQPDYSFALEDTLNSYFDLIKNHGLQNKELGGVINRFLILLHNFITEDSSHAVKYIQKHSSVLHDLSAVHPDMQSLRSLLAGISLPCHTDDSLQEDLVPTLLSFTPSQATPSRIEGQMMPLLNRLSKDDNYEEILSALQELDSFSTRKPDVIEYFVDELKKLISCGNESCRNIAHNLVIRQIKQKPRTSKEFLNSILCCLDNENQEVVISALERMAEFVILSQENASLILQKAFSVGISTSINTLPYIAETMMLLNMQSGS